MPALEGGSALPVTTGGSGQTEARAAVPVYVVSGSAPVIGQKARRVVVVTDGPVEGGAAKPVYDMGTGAVYSAEPALPVYVVSGSLGSDPTLAYTNKVKALNPIAYWPEAEPSGTTIVDESGNGRNGTYSNVTLGQSGIGDGRTSALYVPASNSYGNVYSAGLAGAFNGAAGTVALWVKVRAASVWSDGTVRMLFRLLSDGNNYIQVQKDVAAGTFKFEYAAGGTFKTRFSAAQSSTNFLHIAATWDKAADQVKCYIAGVQEGATLTGLGVYAGALDANFCVMWGSAQRHCRLCSICQAWVLRISRLASSGWWSCSAPTASCRGISGPMKRGRSSRSRKASRRWRA